ncbi:hypothetical protein [Microcystis phage MaeS]|nr:hypothetical protein [Microcystis phage MaeS]
MAAKDTNEQVAKFIWQRHTALLDLVDLVEQPKLRAKLKTKILDVAHEVQEEIKQNKEE